MANELYVQRTAVAELVLTGSTAAFTQSSGEYIPVGAIVTGYRIICGNTAAVNTGASQTVVPKIGSAAIGATLNVSTLPAQTVGLTQAPGAAHGFIVMTAGELNIVGGATGTSTGSGNWKYYVDYLYVVE
jgi:hypothetical protein